MLSTGMIGLMPLVECDEVLDALQVYAGDVVEYPTLSGPMTIAGHTQ